MSVKIRTISQLPTATKLEKNALFEVSQPINSTTNEVIHYVSNNVTYDNLESQLSADVTSKIINRFHLQKDAADLNVSEIYDIAHALSSEDCAIAGEKTFATIPRVDADYSTTQLADNMVATVELVNKKVKESGEYISEDSIVVGKPGNNVRYTVHDDKFMHWKIGENQMDSSEYIDTTGYAVGPKVCTYTGNLVVYGWLADNGDVEPQDAWVGIYGYIHTTTGSEDERDWVLLQLQPWPLTTKSSTFQYVSFNLKVAKGLKLKIKTGFRVKGNNSGFQGSSTLTYRTNQPNSFVGYFVTTTENYLA